MNLPSHQQNIFESVVSKATSIQLLKFLNLNVVVNFTIAEKDVVVLLFNAGPLNINSGVNASNVKSILECFFPGQSGGEAIKHVILNDIIGANPAGRLPFTWPMSLKDV